MGLAHTTADEAKAIEVEAIRRAALNLDAFIDDNASREERAAVYLRLADRYNKLLDEFKLDGLGLPLEQPAL